MKPHVMKGSSLKAFLFAALVLQSAGVFAYQVPGYSADSRVRRVLYDPNDMVRVVAQRGAGTQIVLDANEHIIAAAPGDRDNWDIVAKKGDSNVYLKPKGGAHDSNLVLHTDRRNYTFELIVLPLSAKPVNDEVMFRVTFDYPAGRTGSGAASAASIAARMIQAREATPAPVRNMRYTMQALVHSEDIVPSAMWDDGRFTYIRIPDNRKIPAIFRVADDGSESVVDRHMEGDTIVVHEIAKCFVLRLADEAVELWNDAYDMDGVPPAKGTTVPGVARVVRGSPGGGND